MWWRRSKSWSEWQIQVANTLERSPVPVVLAVPEGQGAALQCLWEAELESHMLQKDLIPDTGCSFKVISFCFRVQGIVFLSFSRLRDIWAAGLNFSLAFCGFCLGLECHSRSLCLSQETWTVHKHQETPLQGSLLQGTSYTVQDALDLGTCSIQPRMDPALHHQGLRRVRL